MKFQVLNIITGLLLLLATKNVEPKSNESDDPETARKVNQALKNEIEENVLIEIKKGRNKNYQLINIMDITSSPGIAGAYHILYEVTLKDVETNSREICNRKHSNYSSILTLCWNRYVKISIM